jgi:hypothetical protein
MASTPPRVVAGITGIPQRMGTIHSPIDIVLNLEMPVRVGSGDMRKVQRDLELLTNLVRHHTREMCDLHNAVVEGRVADAVIIGRKLGLQEHRFIAAGGGAAWLPIVAGVMAALMFFEAVAGPIVGAGETGDPHTETGEMGGGESGEGESGGEGPPE